MQLCLQSKAAAHTPRGVDSVSTGGSALTTTRGWLRARNTRFSLAQSGPFGSRRGRGVSLALPAPEAALRTAAPALSLLPAPARRSAADSPEGSSGALRTLPPHPARCAPPCAAFRCPARRCARLPPPSSPIHLPAGARTRAVPTAAARAPARASPDPGAAQRVRRLSPPPVSPPGFPDSLPRARARSRWWQRRAGPVRERGAIRVSFSRRRRRRRRRRPRASGRDASPPGAHRRRQPRGQLLLGGQRRGHPLHGERGEGLS